jgi:hypothetical protein
MAGYPDTRLDKFLPWHWKRPAPDENGFAEAAQTFADGFSNWTNLQVACPIGEGVEELSIDLRRAFFRVIQGDVERTPPCSRHERSRGPASDACGGHPERGRQRARHASTTRRVKW